MKSYNNQLGAISRRRQGRRLGQSVSCEYFVMDLCLLWDVHYQRYLNECRGTRLDRVTLLLVGRLDAAYKIALVFHHGNTTDESFPPLI